MKKILTLVSAIALVFTSCSSDDSATNENENSLLKKTILTEGGNTETYDWTYDGNKLVSNISNDGSKLLYAYTGDLLTKIEEFDGASLEFTTNYFYNNGKLVSMEEISTGSSQKERTDYTHNSDGTVSFTKYAIVIATNATSTINHGKLFFANNNVIKREENSTYSNKTTTYLYDDKKNPFMNVVGLDKLFDDARSSKNNVVKETEVVEDTFGGTTNTYITTNVYTYNASGYPITVVETQQSGDVASYQLLY